MHENKEERLLRYQEVIYRLGISRTELYEMIGDKKFPRPIKFGRASRWKKSWVDGFLEAL